MQQASAMLLDDEHAKVRPNLWHQCGRIRCLKTDVDLSDSLPAHVQLHAEQQTCNAA
jgi:hypothetical protein